MRLDSRVFGILLSLAVSPAFAEDSYIDLIKEGMPEEDRSAPASGEYLRELQQKLQSEDPGAALGDESYSELIREGAEPAPTDVYTETLKQSIPEASEVERESAITRVKEGRSELKANKAGRVRSAAGFRVGAAASREVIASRAFEQRAFKDIYGDGWKPDFTLFYEYQPIRGWYGNFGILTSIGVGIFSGTGQFAFILPRPAGGTFPAQSRVSLKFFLVPVSVGAKYTFVLGKYLQPYVYGGPSAVFYMETRSNGNKVQGYSKGAQAGGGVNILLDFLTPGQSWTNYADYGIHNYYLTVDYTRTQTFASDVEFTVNQFSAGLTYEF